MIITAAAAAIKNARRYQEDAFRLATRDGVVDGDAVETTRRLVAIVADGMGGGGHGDLASHMIADRVATRLTEVPVSGSALEAAANEANQDIAAKKTSDANLKGMGATLIAAVFEAGDLTFCAVGDSLLYRIRDGELHALNEKHKAAIQADMAALSGAMRWEDALSLRARESAINSAIAGVKIPHMQAATRPLQPGDVYVVASDGVAAIDPDLLRRIVEGGASVNLAVTAQKVLEAVQMTSEHGDGNGDNATIILVRCGDAAASQRTVVGEADTETTIAERVAAPPAPPSATRGPSARTIALALFIGAIIGVGIAAALAVLWTLP